MWRKLLYEKYITFTFHKCFPIAENSSIKIRGMCNTHDEAKNYRYEILIRTPEQKR